MDMEAYDQLPTILRRAVGQMRMCQCDTSMFVLHLLKFNPVDRILKIIPELEAQSIRDHNKCQEQRYEYYKNQKLAAQHSQRPRDLRSPTPGVPQKAA